MLLLLEYEYKKDHPSFTSLSNVHRQGEAHLTRSHSTTNNTKYTATSSYYTLSI